VSLVGALKTRLAPQFFGTRSRDGRRWLRTGDPAATVFGSFCATFWLFWSGRMLDAGDDFEDRDRRAQSATTSVCERRFSDGSRSLVCRCDMMSRDKLATAVGGLLLVGERGEC
jgi:hypothetical protein